MLSEPDVRTVPVYIYGLADPRDLKIRYVGRSQDPKKRLTAHAGPRHGSYRISHWIDALRRDGVKPQIVILSVVRPGDDATSRERNAIVQAVNEGCVLLNYAGMPTKPLKLDCRRPRDIVHEKTLVDRGCYQKPEPAPAAE